MSDNTYQPPPIWEWDKEQHASRFSGNRPVSGSTHTQHLPQGEHPLQLYSMGTPNGQKVTIMLEELLALGLHEAQYDAHLIDIGEGDQFSSGFVDINPNSKIPALYDTQTQSRVFESGAILIYLATKFNALLPSSTQARTEALNWLFWLQGSAPYLGGGFGHFYAYADEKLAYPINRFAMEVKRQMDVLDKHLADHTYLGGEQYSIADIAIWPWYGCLVLGELYDAGKFLQVDNYTHLKKWALCIAQRPAVKRGRIVNRTWGEDNQQLAERHSPDDFNGLDI